MSALRNLSLITIVLLLLVGVTACDRTITRVEQVADQPSSCFNCHGDDNTALISAQLAWENSRHASGLNTNRATADCSGCHTGDGFIARAEGNIPEAYDNPSVIHCFTCHAPHSNGDFGLRWTEMATLEDGTTFDLHAGNLCVACHHARDDVNTFVRTGGDVTISSTHWGPHHGPQGDMLLGSNGYEYDSYGYEQTPYHRTLTQDGCVDCHFKTTRNFVVGGHSFNMEADLEGSTVRNTAACAACHTGLSDFNYNSVQDSVATMLTTLETSLEDAGLFTSGHPVAQTVAEADAGAMWNYLLVEEDRSMGVHNSKYIIGLLDSSIQYLADKKSVAPLALVDQD